MANPQLVRTNIVELCQLIEDRLNLLQVVEDPSQILWSVRKGELPHIKGKKDLVIRPRRGQDLRSFEHGGQRYGMVCVRTVDLMLRTSFGGTELASDKAWLVQHVDFEDGVLNALAGQLIFDDLGNQYLTCPIHYLGTTEEVKEANDPAKNLWGNSILSFELHYKPKLVLTQIE